MKYFFGFSVFFNVILLALLGTCAYLFTIHKINFAEPQTSVTQTQNYKPVTINKTYSLPIAKDSTQAPLQLTITTVQKTTKITVGDKDFMTKNNKAFLVVNTKMVNTGTKPIQLSASDYVLLSQSNQLTPAPYKALTTTLQSNGSYESGMVFLIDNSQNSFTLSIGNNVNKESILPISL